MTIFLDIETRSAADLKEVGAHRYAEENSHSRLSISSISFSLTT